MCLLAPLRVIAVDGDEVLVETGAGTRRVRAFDRVPTPGGWVIVMGDHVVRTLEADTAAALEDAIGRTRTPGVPGVPVGTEDVDDAMA